MIAIVNIGSKDNDLGGWHDYELRINKRVLGKFTHKRSDGLSDCLEKAAVVARKIEDDTFYSSLEAMRQYSGKRK